MAKEFSRLFDFHKSTRGGARLAAGCAAGALIALSFIAGMEFSVATAQIETERPRQTVDRAQKGDRLPASSSSQQKAVIQPRAVIVPSRPARDLRLPEGCDPLVSPIVDDQLARIAGRCVS